MNCIYIPGELVNQIWKGMKVVMKKLLAVLLVCAMVISLAACSGGGESSAKSESSGSESSSADGGDSGYTGPMTLEEVPSPVKDPFEKYDPPIDVTMVHSGSDGAFWFPEGDSIDSNIYTRTYSERLGVNYSFKWTCPGSQSTEKMNTMLASGDLPDFLSVDRTTFEKMYSAGLLADITVPLIEYASEYTRNYLTGDFSYLLDAATKDGRYYGITNGFSYKDGGEMIWLRKDWMDKLNLEKPKTLEDLEGIMEAFKSQDPDGNGEADTYAIALNAASQSPWEWTMNNAYFNMFGSYPNIWYENSKKEIEDGMFGAEARANTRTALEKAAEYYAQGYISQDFATMDSDMRHEDIFNGKCGIVFGDVWAAYWPLILHQDIDPNADWIPVAVASAGSGEAKIARDVASVANILVATKDCKNPEALVKMSNLYHDLNNNPETMEFAEFNTWPSDSNQIFLCYPLLIYNPAFNYEGYQQISEAQANGTTDQLCEAYKMFYDQAMEYEETGKGGGFSPYRSYLQGDTSLSVIDTYIQNKRIVFNEFTREDTQFMIDNKPTVKKMYDEMVINVITGKADISAFDDFVAQWDDIYGTQATTEVNDWFKSNGGVSVQSKMG